MKVIIIETCPFCQRVLLLASLCNVTSQINFEAVTGGLAPYKILGVQTVPAMEQQEGSYLCDSKEICRIIAKSHSIEIKEGSNNLEENVLSIYRLISEKSFSLISPAAQHIVQRKTTELIEYCSAVERPQNDLSVISSLPWLIRLVRSQPSLPRHSDLNQILRQWSTTEYVYLKNSK